MGASISRGASHLMNWEDGVWSPANLAATLFPAVFFNNVADRRSFTKGVSQKNPGFLVHANSLNIFTLEAVFQKLCFKICFCV